MAPKRLLSIVTACLLGAVGVLSIEQKQNQKHYANAYLAQEARMAEFNAAWREPEDDEDFVAIRLFSEPHYQGSYCSINYQHLRGGYCVDLPPQAKAKSVTLSDGVGCCLLYRSPCPALGRSDYHYQSAGFFHQKIFGKKVDDLTPFGFTEHPKSVICPPKDICDGFLLDRNWSPQKEINMAPWWVDYRYIPDRRSI